MALNLKPIGGIQEGELFFILIKYRFKNVSWLSLDKLTMRWKEANLHVPYNLFICAVLYIPPVVILATMNTSVAWLIRRCEFCKTFKNEFFIEDA